MTNDLLQRAKELLIEVQTYKHLQGRHNQLSHGYRLSKTPSLAKARQYRQEGLLQDYLGRARERQGTKPSKVRQGDKPKPEVPQDDEITAKYKVARKEYDAAVDEYLEKTKADFALLTRAKIAEGYKNDLYEAQKRIRENASELETAKFFLQSYQKKPKELFENDKRMQESLDKYAKKVAGLEKKIENDKKIISGLEQKEKDFPSMAEVNSATNRITVAQKELQDRTMSQTNDIMNYHLINAKSLRENFVSEIEGIKGDTSNYFEHFESTTFFLDKQVSTSIMSMEASARTRLYQSESGRTNAVIPNDASKGRTQEGIDVAMSLIGKNRLMEQYTTFFENSRGRASQNGNEAAGIIELSKNDGIDVVVHELGHALEKVDPTIFAKSISFLERRTQGETITHLGNGFGRDEVAKFDKFADPYMGKIYKFEDRYYATEILSMGLQMFSKNPLKLAKLDPDYFDFIYAVTRLNA